MKVFPSTSRLAVLTTLVLVSSAGAADWSHIMGPDINRKTSETAAPWTAGKPKRIWQIPAVGGFSSFVTGDGKAFTVIGKNGRETAMAVDSTTGKTLWEVAFGNTDYRGGGERGVPGNDGGDGPRSTPVYSDKRVFIFGGKFDLNALDSTTGKILWQHDLIKEFGGSEIVWANAASPLVLGDRVLVSGGGANQSFIAFKADTGEVLWKSGSDRPTHATPIITTIHGKKQALFRVERGVVSLDPENGRELWHYPFPHRTATAPSAVVWNDIVSVSSGYGVGGGACQITRNGESWGATELWRLPGNETGAHWMTSVAHDGYLYGCFGHNAFGSGSFKSIDMRTGKVMWAQPGFGHGQVIMAGNRLLATTDAGALTLIEPTPTAYKQLAQADIIEGKVWASPAFSNGQVFLRSTTHGVCVEL